MAENACPTIPFKNMDIQPTIDYLGVFFEGHIDEFRKMMRDAGGSRHPEAYEGRTDAIQCIRNLVHGIENEFADMSIPSGYSSPNRLHSRLVSYQEMAYGQMQKIEEIVEENEGNWFSETSYAYQISHDVYDAITHALTLSDTQFPKNTALDRLLKIVTALPSVARQLSKRRKDDGKARPTLTIADEYDVQDLLHSVLCIEFSDIRSEEAVPSFSGANKRADFLLVPEKILIEVKKTRKTLAQRGISEELTIDIAAYKKHPGSVHLVCVVWDVECILENPAALKTDLEAIYPGGVTVVVLR